MSDIVIYGRGKTGQCLKKMLSRQGKDAVFYDDKSGFDGGGSFESKTLVLLSPGVKPDSFGVIEAKKAGAVLMSELEYCFGYCLGKCVSVTGTNGKTTTCEMIYRILKEANLPCRLLGNGGVPFSSEVLDVLPNEIVVLESSSFQLTNALSFAPYISVFTNIACDHLDYHGSIESYVEAKTNNFSHQREGYAIFNADDYNVAEISRKCQCAKLYYSTFDVGANCYFDGNNVVVNIDGKKISSSAQFLKKYAEHNLSNALAAILTCVLLDVGLEAVLQSLEGYRLLPHRMETIAEIDGVTFVDDSKATNVHATVNALKNYRQPLALILGGSDKGEKFDDIFANLTDNVIAVAASGGTAMQISDCGKAYGVEVALFDDIADAAEYCFGVLKSSGGVVLMSNACASFDKFGGYAERGEYFRKVVGELKHGKKTD